MAFCNELDAKTKVNLYISWKIKDIVRIKMLFRILICIMRHKHNWL